MIVRRNSNKGNVMLVVLGIILIVGIGFVLLNKPPPKPPEKTPREKAEATLKKYVQAAWDYTHANNLVLQNDIKAMVPKADWDWYMNNIDRLIEDHFKLMDYMDATAQSVIKRKTVLDNILKSGIHQPTFELLKTTQISSTQFEFLCKQMEPYYGEGEKTYEELNVVVAKQGKRWKVKRWAGARDKVTGF